MRHGLYVVDFHAHIVGQADFESFFAEDCQSNFIRQVGPFLEKLLHLSDPHLSDFLRNLSFNFRHELARSLYDSCGHIGLVEAIRIFKSHNFEFLLNSMDKQGIDHVVISSLEPLTVTENLIKLVANHRDRFSIFASVHRNQENAAGYFQSLLDTGAVRGLKLHPLVGGYNCGELLDKTKEVLQIASDNNLPVFIHTGHIPTGTLTGLNGCNDARAVEPLLAEFPKINFVLAHIGWESWRTMLKLARKYPRVYVETSWQPASIIRRAVDTLGSHRVIFGSDFPLFKQSMAIKQVEEALTPYELAAVASANAARLLKLPKFGQPETKAPNATKDLAPI